MSIFLFIAANGFSSDTPIGSGEQNLPLKKPSGRLEILEAGADRIQ